MKKILIVGGGIIGLSIAHYLQRSGLAQVTLLEAENYAAATTSQAAALLTRARSTITDGMMVDETHRIIKTFEEKFHLPFMKRDGCIHIANQGKTYQEEVNNLRNHYQQSKDRQSYSCSQLKCQWLSSSEISERLPWIDIKEGSTGLFYPDDGHADPYLLANFYRKSAKENGACLYQGARVKHLIELNERIVGACTDNNEKWIADSVVLAGGPWTSILAHQHNIKLAMAPIRSHYWITDNQALVKERDSMAIVPSSRAYFRPENKGILFGIRDTKTCIVNPLDLPSSQQGLHDYDFKQDSNGWLALEENLQELMEVCPLLETAQLNHYISGISSYTPDGLPLLGKAPEKKNLFMATGCSGAGIAWSGGIGRLLSEIVLEKETFVNSKRYALNRFDKKIKHADSMDADFRKVCAEARINKKTG